MTFPRLERMWSASLLAALVLIVSPTLPASAQPLGELEGEAGDDLVTLDFADVELATVIDTIARLTGQNFIYDDRVRGRVTIISPTPVPLDQAYTVFESVLQVKGFTTVRTPGGTIKVVPLREAKESSVETVQSSQRPPNRDHFVTRLIPLRYIDAESIVNTLKPLVSKDAHMAPYSPTNTVILTESSSNIRRIIAILESIDIETYKEELAVISIEHADAATLADQISEIYGAQVTQASGGAAARRASSRRRSGAQPDTTTSGTKRVPVRILTDERTNSLLVLAPRQQLEEVRRLVTRLDVPVIGGGRIHVYYLKNANAEELAQTLSGLIGGGSTPSGGSVGGGAAAQALRSTVASLTGGISVTADPAINALIIQASKEGYETLVGVIEQLDIVRPQVLVEALIMEVNITDNNELGFGAFIQYINGDTQLAFRTAGAIVSGGLTEIPSLPGLINAGAPDPPGGFGGGFGRDTTAGRTEDGTLIQGLIRASASNGDTSIISAPHILTSDNEQAEIRIGDNIPIVTNRVQSASGNVAGLSSSVGVERQDIGVTLRVTPQITEGDTLRLEIFQEISGVNSGLSADTGNPTEVGVALTNRVVENTVVVADGETVVIGGLIGDQVDETVSKVPWLGDIPVLGWAFKQTVNKVKKTNLLIFLTPHIVRSAEDLEGQSIRKREEFKQNSSESLAISDEIVTSEFQRMQEATLQGVPYFPAEAPTQLHAEVAGHTARYPKKRIGEIDAARREADAAEAAQLKAQEYPPSYHLKVAVFGDPGAAATLLTDLIDSGHDGTLESTEAAGSLVYEIVLGPYHSLEDATAISQVVQRSHGLTPVILVEAPGAEQP